MAEAPPKTTNPAYVMAELPRIKVGNLHRKDYGDLPGLAASMAVVGQLQPIGLNRNNELLWGLRRLKAAGILEWGRIAAVVVDCEPENATLVEYHENFCRKDFTVSEKVKIGKALEAVVGERRGRPSSGSVQEDSDISRKCGELNQGERTDEAAAATAGFGSADTYARAKAVAESGNPALISLVDDGKVSVAMGAQVVKLSQERQRQFVAAVIDGKTPASALKAALPVDDALHINQRMQEWIESGELAGVEKEQALAIGGNNNAAREAKQSQYVRRRMKPNNMTHAEAMKSVRSGGKREPASIAPKPAATDEERQDAKEQYLEALGAVEVHSATLGVLVGAKPHVEALAAMV